ncbi:MAG TPA: ArsR family transcriptional regulator [Thermodesulfobacteriota bacterium]|nr:ArsR family transcriptional regulator [Thermodesulfobacteriota bacterium]
MATVERVSAQEARRAAAAGRALLVCAYEDDTKCRQMALEGALSFAQFKAQEGALPKDREIIFYCA